MRIFFIALSILLTLASCNSIPTSNLVSGTVPNDTIPLRGFSKVSVHPDKLLKINTNCDLAMRIEIVQSKNYAETIMELKNRALLIGGNAMVEILPEKESYLKNNKKEKQDQCNLEELKFHKKHLLEY